MTNESGFLRCGVVSGAVKRRRLDARVAQLTVDKGAFG